MDQKDNDAKRRQYENMLRKKMEECIAAKVELQDKVDKAMKKAGVCREIANVYERYYGQTEIWERKSDEALVAYLDYQEAVIDLECMELKVTRLGERINELWSDRNTNSEPPIQ